MADVGDARDLDSEAEGFEREAERRVRRSREIADLTRSPGEFSEPAETAIKDTIDDFVRTLLVESFQISKRRGSDSVSKADVQDVARYLFHARRTKFTEHLGTLGGILLGAGISNLPALASADKIELASVLITVALAVVGVALVAFHVARTLR